MSLPSLRPGQRARIRIWDRASSEVRTVFESGSLHMEAPNWTTAGELLINAEGGLWLLPADGSAAPRRLETPGLPDVNNDHVPAPDGTRVFASANDFHIWEVPFDGSPVRRITEEDGGLHFLHGVSPDGTRLAYVHLAPDGDDWWASATIRTVDLDGGDPVHVTSHPGPADGPGWSPDGQWIYFNTEQFSETTGHAQIARVRPDGTGLEQLTTGERVSWFPHLAPTGDVAVHLTFPPGTTGHPGDLPVDLRLVTLEAPGAPAAEAAAAWNGAEVIVRLHGGQGTINVPSWAPDGSGFAFVDYPAGDDA